MPSSIACGRVKGHIWESSTARRWRLATALTATPRLAAAPPRLPAAVSTITSCQRLLQLAWGGWSRGAGSLDPKRQLLGIFRAGHGLTARPASRRAIDTALFHRGTPGTPPGPCRPDLQITLCRRGLHTAIHNGGGPCKASGGQGHGGGRAAGGRGAAGGQAGRGRRGTAGAAAERNAVGPRSAPPLRPRCVTPASGAPPAAGYQWQPCTGPF